LIDDYFFGAIRNSMPLAYNPEKAKALLAKARGEYILEAGWGESDR